LKSVHHIGVDCFYLFVHWVIPEPTNKISKSSLFLCTYINGEADSRVSGGKNFNFISK